MVTRGRRDIKMNTATVMGSVRGDLNQGHRVRGAVLALVYHYIGG
jgi:hypothetical protein